LHYSFFTVKPQKPFIVKICSIFFISPQNSTGLFMTWVRCNPIGKPL